jgi:hypothetical protein
MSARNGKDGYFDSKYIFCAEKTPNIGLFEK